MNTSLPLNQQIPGFTGTFEEVIQITWATEFLDVAAAALLCYDVFLSFEREVQLVWCGRWGLPTVLYLVNRYGVALQACLNLVAVLDWQLDLDSCYTWNLFSNWSIPVVMMIVEALLAMRVMALYFNNRWVVLFLWLWWLCAAAAMLAMMGVSLVGTIAVASPAPPTLGCQIQGSVSDYWALWVPSLVFETTVASLTLARAISYRTMITDIPIMRVLVRDGFLYFFVIMVLMLVNLVICLTTSSLYYSWFPQISISIASALAVRLFLNLREAAQKPTFSSVGASTVPELFPLEFFNEGVSSA